MTVFVSYKAEDRNRVEPLVEALEADGLSVWWDAHIGGGDEWRETILRNLEAARCVIVVWSKGSTGPHGQFVRDEATRALRRRTYLPVRIDKVEPPLGFGETQALDLQGWDGDRDDPRYRAVVSAIQVRLGMQPKPMPAAGKRRGISRRTAIAGGGVAALAATGIGAWFLVGRDQASSDSIAVLPFANLSGDPAQAYFSDGIAEELRSALSRIAGLKVVARTSSEAVRNDDAKTAARKLGVSNILTGSVRRSPSTIRITAQLVDGRRGLERWSQVYDQPFGDALQIQSDIALKAVQALSIHLGQNVQQVLAAGGTTNAAAQDLLIRARYIIEHDDSQAARQRALGMVESAIALDPRYAHAHSAKATLMLSSGGSNGAEVEPIARHAVALAPNSAETHRVLAFVLFLQLKLRAAWAELEAADSLPGASHGDFEDGFAHVWMLADLERPEALERASEAVVRDPLNPRAYHNKGYVLFTLRRYAEADREFLRAMALAPQFTWSQTFHGFMLMQLGRFDQAEAILSQIPPEFYQATVLQAIIAARRGNRRESERILDQIKRQWGDKMAYQYAQVYAQQGRREEAIAQLELAWKLRDPGLTGLKRDSLLDPLRNDPRFQAIVERLDFPT